MVRDGIASLYVRFGDRRVARLRTDMTAQWVGDDNGDGMTTVADAVLASGDARTRRLRASARRLLHDATESNAHLHADLRGSIIAATGSDGSVIAERSFYPFGLERASTGFVDHFGFTGQEQDDTTELYAFAARYLDARSGRWATVDPLFGVLDGRNLARLGESTSAYAYVANNPINSIDPTGLIAKKLAKLVRRGLRRARRGLRSGRKGAQNRIGKAIDPAAQRLFPNRTSDAEARFDKRRTAVERRVTDARTALTAAESAVDAAQRTRDRVLNEAYSTGGVAAAFAVTETRQALEARQGEAASAREALASAERDLDGLVEGAGERKDLRSNAQVFTGLSLVLSGLVGIGVAVAVGGGEGDDDTGTAADVF